jgi:dihydrofolate reductase
MGKLISSIALSLDGFYSGPNGELDWHNVDEEFDKHSNDLLSSADTLLFGRLTYQLMLNYWADPSVISDNPVIAGPMNQLPKIVFSKTLEKVDWQNTRLLKENIVEEITNLKQQTVRDLVILGSGELTLSLTELGLVDEFQIVLHPVVLGKGKSLSKNIHDKIKLKLLKTKTFHSGNVLLYYQPTNKE